MIYQAYPSVHPSVLGQCIIIGLYLVPTRTLYQAYPSVHHFVLGQCIIISLSLVPTRTCSYCVLGLSFVGTLCTASLLVIAKLITNITLPRSSTLLLLYGTQISLFNQLTTILIIQDV